jgi:RNA polymerase sigma-70 factor (ECF subfamily)
MIDYPKSSEESLISNSAEGDKKAFEELLIRNKKRIEGWILSFTKKPEVVQDIFQISCLKGWRYISSFRKDCTFSTWMCNIARNCFYDFYRAKKRRPEISLDEMLERQVQVGGAFELHCLGSEDHPRNKDQDTRYFLSEIDKKLESLDDIHKEPLMLFAGEGLGYSEIAKKLDIPEGTVMSRIFYARKKARKILKNFKNELVVR